MCVILTQKEDMAQYGGPIDIMVVVCTGGHAGIMLPER